jgi:formamidopyrimidine-DNA glycosylase
MNAVPEYPDVTVYIEHLERRLLGETLQGLRLASPFVLRTVTPSPSDLAGHTVTALSRIGKRIVFHLEGELFIVLHLMIAGRLRWQPARAKIPGRVGVAAFDFPKGTLILTEAGTKKRASLHILSGKAALAEHDPGGLEIFEIDAETFSLQLRRERHTLKRSLTDPRLFAGIGNAYSDEILHRAKMSPVRMTSQLSDTECKRLFEAIKTVLEEWTERLRAEAGDDFPEHVTAFREGMAVHGRYGQPCPVCGARVQRIVYAENETNYCAPCQTEGRLLADRSLSRLLKEDWPKTLDELEQRRGASR